MDDNELMARLKQGDTDALSLLIRRHRPWALARAEGMLHDAALAEDVVQEAFVRVYLLRDRYSPAFAFSTWLGALVRNLCIDQLRRRKRRPTVPLEDWQGIETQPRGESPLADCMLRLPAVERQLLWLKYYQGYELKEIGPMLGLSYDAVTRLHRRAKEQLRELYEKERSR